MRNEPTESLDEGRITFDAPASESPCFDPVCGRQVNASALFTPKLQQDGQQYAFCSVACRARFKSNPLAYKTEHHA